MANVRSLKFCSCFHPPFLSPKPSILFPSLPIFPFSHFKRTSCLSFKILSTPKTTSSSSSSQDSVSGNFGIVSTTEYSDGSVLFQFGEVNQISENVIIGESTVSELENVDKVDVISSSKVEVESSSGLVDCVQEVGLCEEGSSGSIHGERLVENAVSDVKSSDETHEPETIYFKVLTPVSISELDYAIKDGTSGSLGNFTTSAIDPGLDTVSFKDEESEVEITSALVEQDEVLSSLASQAGTTTEDYTIEHMEETDEIVNGGKSENFEVVPLWNSLDAEVILQDKPIDTGMEEEPAGQPNQDEVDEKPTQNVVDEEPIQATVNEDLTHDTVDEENVEQLTADAVDDQPINDIVDEHEEQEQLTANAVNEEPIHDIVDEENVGQLTANTVDEEPIHDVVDEHEEQEQVTANAVDEEPIHDIVDELEEQEQLTANVVDEEPSHTIDQEPTPSELAEVSIEQPIHSAVAEEPIRSAVEEKPSLEELVKVPVEQASAVAEESIQSAVQEELTHDIVDEEPIHAVDVEPADNEGVSDLMMLDGNLPSSPLVEETAEVDVGSSSNGDVSIPRASLQMTEATETQQEVLMSGHFLISGATSLAHPHKALTGRQDAYFVHQNWLGIVDGVGQWSFEGTNAGKYAQEFIKNCGKIVADDGNSSITDPVGVLDKAVMETESPGSSTALVAYFDGQALHVANIGDSGFLIIRNSTIFKKSSRKEYEFNFPVQMEKGDNPSELVEGYKIGLDDGDVIITASDGLFDNLYEQEIASIVSRSLEASLMPQKIAELLARRAQEVGQSKSVRSPFADAAQAAGYVGYTGGKLDDVTVIVSLLRKSSPSASALQ